MLSSAPRGHLQPLVLKHIVHCSKNTMLMKRLRLRDETHSHIERYEMRCTLTNYWSVTCSCIEGFKHFLMHFPFPEQFGIVWEPPMMHRSFSDWCSLILQQENETWGWVASDTLLFGRLSSRHHCDKDDSKSETSCPGPLLQSTVLWICAHTRAHTHTVSISDTFRCLAFVLMEELARLLKAVN